MSIIEKVLTHKSLIESPPVLIDIGASGEINAKWKTIARHSICIAFDADDREMGFTEKESDTFKKLFVFSRVVTDQNANEIDFYLTQSPFCSSSLEPDLAKLKNWSFHDQFLVEKKIKLKSIRLTDALREAKIDRIDWFKTDTQGTDLRLFKNLPDEIRNKVAMAEFEPGIIDAYRGEDKLHEVIRYMDEIGFYMCRFDVKGAHRINADETRGWSTFHQKAMKKCLAPSPGWAEVSFLNGLRGASDVRTILLTYLFATVENQFGYAIEVAKKGHEATGDPVFLDLKNDAINKIKRANLALPWVMMKKAGSKLLSYL